MKKGLLKIIEVFALIVVVIFTLLTACNKNTPEEKKEIIGIIGAMDVEVEMLQEHMQKEKVTEISDMDFYIGTISKSNVVIVKCDMGKVNAGICASLLINEFGCTKIINTGVAGALDNRLKMGDIVVSTGAVQHDFDASPLGYKYGEIPYTGMVEFEADEELINKAYTSAKECHKNVNVYKGRICSGDQFIDTKEEKEKIISNFGGLCCEMEGGAVAQVCYLNKTPFVIIRSVSDTPGETEISEYKEKEADFSLSCAKVVEYMIENY